MIDINPVEGVWLAIGSFAAVTTLLNLIDANRSRRATRGTSLPWQIQARANVRREAVSFVMALAAVFIVIPSLLRPGDVELSALVLALMAFPGGLAVNSFLDARTRRTLARLVAFDLRETPSSVAAE